MVRFLICMNPQCRGVVDFGENEKIKDTSPIACQKCGRLLSFLCPFCGRLLDVFWNQEVAHCLRCGEALKPKLS
jgi:DNA-directed RNA polymerase subunit RPC12/RpoP